MKKQTIKEKDVEREVSQYATALGCLSYKFTSPTNRGVPDRIYLYNGHALFIEFKGPKAPFHFSPLQQKQRDRIAEVSCPVFLVNDIAKGCHIINQFVLLHKAI